MRKCETGTLSHNEIAALAITAHGSELLDVSLWNLISDRLFLLFTVSATPFEMC